MSIDRDVVGRIGEHHLGQLTVQQRLIGVTAGGIGAKKSVHAALPEIADLGDRHQRPVWFRDGLRDLVV